MTSILNCEKITVDMFSCARVATGTGGELVDDFDSRKELKAVARKQAPYVFFCFRIARGQAIDRRACNGPCAI